MPDLSEVVGYAHEPWFAQLTDPGLPRTFFDPLFVRRDRATLEALPDGRTMVAIGFTSYSRFPVLIDLRSGSVAAWGGPNRDREYPINSGIREFAESMIAVWGLLPLYSAEDDLDSWEQAAARVLSTVASIDPPAATWTGFWQDFSDDVANGDFTAEDLAVYGEDAGRDGPASSSAQ